MEFTNKEILQEELPTVNAIQFMPLERSYLVVQRISFAITILFICIIASVLIITIDELQQPIVLYSSSGIVLLIAVCIWIANSISFQHSGYALRDKDILFRKGWLVQKIRIVPLNRVQHVSIQSGPIERRYRLASVSIYTAGSSAADLTIRGITADTAQQIKEWISNQLNGAINI